MKIKKIEIADVLGLARADIDTSRPITVIAGNNEAGKSTIADAINMALIGQPKRVKLKKELAQLLHDGAKKGRITLLGMDDEAIGEYKLPGGQHVVAENIAGADFLEFVIDPNAFARQSAADRRSLLFKLTKCKASPDATEKMLIESGVSPALAAEIKPALRSGFPSACEEAKSKATEYKGIWRSITGENWGAAKSADWAPEAPEVEITQQQIDQAADEAAALDSDLSEASTTLGEKRQQLKAQNESSAELARLEEQAELLERRQNKLKVDQDTLAEWEAKLVAAEQAATGAPAHNELTCPHCQNTVALIEGELQAYEAPEHAPDLEAGKRAAEYRGYVDTTKRAIENDRRDIAQSEAAAERLKELRENQATVVSEEAIANAAETINTLRIERDKARAKHTALTDAFAEISERDNKIKAAATSHENVMAWLAVADQLSPDGIPSRILASAIAPVNESLAVLAGRAFWKKTQITSDMEITCDGRLYGLMSESAKWRADTLIALAIAQISGLRLVVLDRFDVLDSDSRIELLGLLKDLAEADAMDTMIMCGTMKSLPDFKDPNVGAVWVKNGIAES